MTRNKRINHRWTGMSGLWRIWIWQFLCTARFFIQSSPEEILLRSFWGLRQTGSGDRMQKPPLSLSVRACRWELSYVCLWTFYWHGTRHLSRFSSFFPRDASRLMPRGFPSVPISKPRIKKTILVVSAMMKTTIPEIWRKVICPFEVTDRLLTVEILSWILFWLVKVPCHLYWNVFKMGKWRCLGWFGSRRWNEDD